MSVASISRKWMSEMRILIRLPWTELPLTENGTLVPREDYEPCLATLKGRVFYITSSLFTVKDTGLPKACSYSKSCGF